MSEHISYDYVWLVWLQSVVLESRDFDLKAFLEEFAWPNHSSAQSPLVEVVCYNR